MFKKPVDIQQPWSKKYWGKKQKRTAGYELIARLGVFYKHSWLIFAREPKEGSDWMDFRLSVVGAITGRANYTFGWNGKRFAMGQDMRDIKEHRPLLFARFVEELQDKGFIDKDYELDEKI